MIGSFKPGNNIAMKVPPHQYDETLRFYREVLCLPELTPNEADATPRFDFGGKVLWLDSVETCTHAELWLEVTHPDPEVAAHTLASSGVVRCDYVETLPDEFNGFWITSPCNIVHLVSDESAA